MKKYTFVLGVHDGHNASATLMRNGQILAAVQEERFSRVKNEGGYPRRAIEAVLQAAEIKQGDVDVFAFADQYHTEQRWDHDSVVKLFENNSRTRARLWAGQNPTLRTYRRRQLASARRRRLLELGLPDERTVITEHHSCHAAAAYFGQETRDQPILVFTVDGTGDYLSGSVSIGDGNKLSRLVEVSNNDSLGLLYANVTFLLGMTPLEHEYKVMGLAPYGDRSTKHAERLQRKFQALFTFEAPYLSWRASPRLQREPLVVLKELMYRERFDSISAGLQNFLEDILVRWVEAWIRKTGISRIALGGGVFMNVKANKRILESSEVESLFIMPSSGDETNCIGAAYLAHLSRSPDGKDAEVKPLSHLYLGPTITEGEAEEALSDSAGRVEWQRSSDPEGAVAELLSQGNVVARAAGAMEFGARSLGNRSILADSSRPEVAQVINDMIKARDFWMPFAPSVMSEASDQYFANPKKASAPYMTLAFDALPDKRKVLRAASHPSDHTIRPQQVLRSWNPGYHSLLQKFGAITGERAILNTSFNLHGYPIVCTAHEAIDVFLNSGLQYMQLDTFIVKKRS